MIEIGTIGVDGEDAPLGAAAFKGGTSCLTNAGQRLSLRPTTSQQTDHSKKANSPLRQQPRPSGAWVTRETARAGGTYDTVPLPVLLGGPLTARLRSARSGSNYRGCGAVERATGSAERAEARSAGWVRERLAQLARTDTRAGWSNPAGPAKDDRCSVRAGSTARGEEDWPTVAHQHRRLCRVAK